MSSTTAFPVADTTAVMPGGGVVPPLRRGTKSLRVVSPRLQDELLPYMQEGWSIPEIAAVLFLSVDGVKCRLRGLYDRLGARNYTHAVSRAYQEGLLPLPVPTPRQALAHG